MKRRTFLKESAALLCAPLLAGPASATATGTLAEKAAKRGLFFGCAVAWNRLGKDRAFADLVSNEVSMLVHEGELKRGNIERNRGRISFAAPTPVFNFAQRNSLKVRGHALCWHEANPAWLPQALEETTGEQREKLLTDYVDKVARNYAGQLHSWDVVNEVIDPLDSAPNGMRAKSIWYNAFGEDYIDLAFHAARQADSETPLYLNELNLESLERWAGDRRTAVLKLLERLKKRNVPIDGFGIQGHLKPYRDPFSQKIFANFLKELQNFDLDIIITEFDVADIDGPRDPVRRDKEIAQHASEFLDVCLSFPTVKGVLTWGLSDRYSWLSSYKSYKWPDGQLSRVLPYDENLEKKPMWQAIADSFDKAPLR